MVVENKLDEDVVSEIKGFPKCKKLWDIMEKDPELSDTLEQANKISIGRMGYNDHGRIHAKVTLLNSLKIYGILEKNGTKGNVIIDEIGDSEDVRIALMIGAYLHDTGMSISRKSHDILGVIVSKDMMTRFLQAVYKDNLEKIVRIRAIVMECVLCHLGSYTSTSIESKIIATADGTDMTKGRARVPYKISKPDIHKFSALSIERVEIIKGQKKPVRIVVEMNDTTGIFQIEIQLMQKIRDVGFTDFIEIEAKIKDGRDYSYW
ncbi:MAG TPA: phosphohydrolase [archaeon]|nr:phosphohydrolase [archaeon]